MRKGEQKEDNIVGTMGKQKECEWVRQIRVKMKIGEDVGRLTKTTSEEQ